MRRFAAILPILALAIACSTLHPTQEKGLGDQVAVLEAFRLDYQDVDCQACASCDAIKAELDATSRAGLGYNAMKATEDQHNAYIAAFLAATATTPECACTQDARICPATISSIAAARRIAESVQRSMARPPWYSNLFGGN